MANLKGRSYSKQIVDAQCRMSAIGQNKQSGDNDSHSLKIQSDRLNMLKDFANFAKNDLNSSEKLNTLMTSENVNNFLQSRTENLAAKSIETYTRAFSSMTKSLNDNNIATSVDKEVFNDIVKEAKLNDNSIVRTDRAINNLNGIYGKLAERHQSSAVVAEVMATYGFRISEAQEAVQNLHTYLNKENGDLDGLRGKGGKPYEGKALSPEIIAKVDKLERIYSKSTTEKDFNAIGEKSHDLRYTWAKNEFEKISAEKNNSSDRETSLNAYKDTLKEVSRGLNHKREDISTQYLSRA